MQLPERELDLDNNGEARPMNISTLFHVEGKVTLLTGVGGFLVSEMAYAAAVQAPGVAGFHSGTEDHAEVRQARVTGWSYALAFFRRIAPCHWCGHCCGWLVYGYDNLRIRNRPAG